MSRSISHGAEADHGKKSGASNSIVDFDSFRNMFAAAVTDARSKISVQTIRPLPVFLGISAHAFCLAQDAFTPPTKKLDKSSLEKIRTRLKLNFAFFISNYALVAAGVALVVALMHPGMLLSLGTLWALWELHSYLISNELVILGKNVGSLVSITHRSNFLMALTAAVVAWKCLGPVMTFTSISGVLIFAHAIMRDPKQMDTSNAKNQRKSGGQFDDDYDSSGSEVVVERPGGKADII